VASALQETSKCNSPIVSVQPSRVNITVRNKNNEIEGAELLEIRSFSWIISLHDWFTPRKIGLLCVISKNFGALRAHFFQITVRSPFHHPEKLDLKRDHHIPYRYRRAPPGHLTQSNNFSVKYLGRKSTPSAHDDQNRPRTAKMALFYLFRRLIAFTTLDQIHIFLSFQLILKYLFEFN
jgi:hypothetical protein